MVFKDKKGIVLIASLLILLALTTIGVIAITTTVTDTKISGNVKDIKQAFYLADAGISHAGALIQQHIGNWDVYLPPSPTTVNLPGFGSYTITARNTGTTPNIMKVVESRGETLTGAKAVIEAIFSRAPFSPDHAVTTSGNLKIGGSVSIRGSKGSVHSNGDLTISGTAVTIDQTASASGTATPPYISDAPEVDIPMIDPTKFARYADYRLTARGEVYKAGSDLPEPMEKGKWHGWDYKGGTWTLSGNDPPPSGMLYIEGDVKVSGNPGDANNPWITTLIATGNIKLSGGPIIADHKDSEDRIGVQNLLFVAGLDIKITGNVTQTGEGIIAARGNIKIGGNPTNLNVCIIATEIMTETTIHGNATITYDGGLASPFFSNTVSMLAWREIRK